VFLLIRPHHLWRSGTLFYPQNASKNSGSIGVPGLKGIEALFASYVGTRRRSPMHLASCPTDDQAEAQIKGGIPVEDITAIIVKSAEQAATERSRWQQINIIDQMPPLGICAAFYDATVLSSLIRRAQSPKIEYLT
jgi:hypothetical protein